MGITVEKTPIEDLLIIRPQIIGDSRGYFLETYNENDWCREGLYMKFVQENQSLSQKGVIRGLHFQKPPFAQGKLVRVLQGSVIDVAVDLRPNSKSFGEHYSIHLTAELFTFFYVPEGFAHGFLTLEDNTVFAYKCTNFYSPEHESGLMWNDPSLNIDWKLDQQPILSKKDEFYPPFQHFSSPF